LVIETPHSLRRIGCWGIEDRLLGGGSIYTEAPMTMGKCSHPAAGRVLPE
jgi:hypothetical protein